MQTKTLLHVFRSRGRAACPLNLVGACIGLRPILVIARIEVWLERASLDPSLEMLFDVMSSAGISLPGNEYP